MNEESRLQAGAITQRGIRPEYTLITMKPRVFVASSAESVEIAEAIHANLDYVAEVTTWSTGFFQLNATALQSLLTGLGTFDFGVFLCTPDDVVLLRGQQVLTSRDNVIFELGLFIGRLGPDRCFIVVPRDHPDLHLPSDLAGSTPGTYDAGRSDRNWRAALVYACSDIKAAIQRLGPYTEHRLVTASVAATDIIPAPQSVKAAVLDQALVDPPNLGASINEGFRYVAQTYTAGMDGMFAGLNINVNSVRQMNPHLKIPIYPLKIELTTVKEQYPDQVVSSITLASDQVLLSDFIEFREPIVQIAGAQYAIVVSYSTAPPHGAGNGVGVWNGCTGNRYPYGNLCFSADGQTWLIDALDEHDLHFRTYVFPH